MLKLLMVVMLPGIVIIIAIVMTIKITAFVFWSFLEALELAWDEIKTVARIYKEYW